MKPRCGHGREFAGMAAPVPERLDRRAGDGKQRNLLGQHRDAADVLLVAPVRGQIARAHQMNRPIRPDSGPRTPARLRSHPPQPDRTRDARPSTVKNVSRAACSVSLGGATPLRAKLSSGYQRNQSSRAPARTAGLMTSAFFSIAAASLRRSLEALLARPQRDARNAWNRWRQTPGARAAKSTHRRPTCVHQPVFQAQRQQQQRAGIASVAGSGSKRSPSTPPTATRPGRSRLLALVVASG